MDYPAKQEVSKTAERTVNSLFVANARSLGNKMDETATWDACMTAITETWLHPGDPDNVIPQ